MKKILVEVFCGTDTLREMIAYAAGRTGLQV